MIIKELEKLRSALGADVILTGLIENRLDVTAIKEVAGQVAHKQVAFDIDLESVHEGRMVDVIAREFSDFIDLKEVPHG